MMLTYYKYDIFLLNNKNTIKFMNCRLPTVKYQTVSQYEHHWTTRILVNKQQTIKYYSQLGKLSNIYHIIIYY